MKTMEPRLGASIQQEIRRAIDIARNGGDPVKFDFNGVNVVVNSDSDPDLICRDWSRGISGYLGENPTVGPHPSQSLSTEELASDAAIQCDRDKKNAAMRAEQTRQADNNRLLLQGALANAGPIELRDAETWAACVEKNQDGYGGRIIRFAEEWARLMQVRLGNGETIADCAEELSRLADDDGITGFMYGAAVSTLAKCWVHGEQLRRWHNKETQIGTEVDAANESGGVLNPALLSVGK